MKTFWFATRASSVPSGVSSSFERNANHRPSMSGLSPNAHTMDLAHQVAPVCECLLEPFELNAILGNGVLIRGVIRTVEHQRSNLVGEQCCEGGTEIGAVRDPEVAEFVVAEGSTDLVHVTSGVSGTQVEQGVRTKLCRNTRCRPVCTGLPPRRRSAAVSGVMST